MFVERSSCSVKSYMFFARISIIFLQADIDFLLPAFCWSFFYKAKAIDS